MKKLCFEHNICICTCYVIWPAPGFATEPILVVLLIHPKCKVTHFTLLLPRIITINALIRCSVACSIRIPEFKPPRKLLRTTLFEFTFRDVSESLSVLYIVL